MQELFAPRNHLTLLRAGPCKGGYGNFKMLKPRGTDCTTAQKICVRVPEHLRSSSISKVDAHTTLWAVSEFQRRVQPQATDAHLGRPRSTMRANRHICRTSSRAAPRERIRTAQDHALAPWCWGERATPTETRHKQPRAHTQRTARAATSTRFTEAAEAAGWTGRLKRKVLRRRV